MSAELPAGGSAGAREQDGRSFRRVVLAVIGALGLLAFAYLAVAMPGMDHGGDTSASEDARMEHGTAGDMRLDVDAFARRLAGDSAILVNVHTPYAGEIEGTDLFVRFDQITGDARLPQSRDAEILLYCETGGMSQTAAETLMGDGYTNVAELDGGMRAWEADGRPIVTR